MGLPFQNADRSGASISSRAKTLDVIAQHRFRFARCSLRMVFGRRIREGRGADGVVARQPCAQKFRERAQYARCVHVQRLFTFGKETRAVGPQKCQRARRVFIESFVQRLQEDPAVSRPEKTQSCLRVLIAAQRPQKRRRLFERSGDFLRVAGDARRQNIRLPQLPWQRNATQ